jgi:hypothetical protein
MPIIKEDGCIVKRNRRDGRYNSTYEGRVFKRPATPVRGRQDEKYAGKIEPSRQQARSSESSRVISQQGNEHSLPQDSRTGSQQGSKNRQSTRKTNTASTREQNRKVPPSARSGNQQAKRQSQKNQTRVSRGRQARPTHPTIQINRQTRQSARETRKVKRSERRKDD